ncbi:MAG: tRNA pseudouridine(55) synthase TruB [Deltaproteobacteria bacterium]|nr:tRNA pseudouridine(55) synthase TruB [Deltaproteobacteria bacterium]
MGPGTDGILLIDKCAGETSHDVVKRIRRVLRGAGRAKIGHAGTLDPFATGLLVVLVGQGTKLSRFIMQGEKTYLATLRLGVETDTLDLEGRVVSMCPVPDVSLTWVQKVAGRFVGRLQQTPPVYSAVRCRGKRAYEFARKGQQVELKAREVTIRGVEILSMALPDIRFCVRCSSGTYVRRLASDLGKALGSGAHLRSLRRVESGAFSVMNALCSAEIGDGIYCASLLKRIIPLREALPGMKEIHISEHMAEKVRQGRPPAWEDLVLGAGGDPGDLSGRWIKLVSRGRLAAIIQVQAADKGPCGTISIERVFLS